MSLRNLSEIVTDTKIIETHLIKPTRKSQECARNPVLICNKFKSSVNVSKQYKQGGVRVA